MGEVVVNAFAQTSKPREGAIPQIVEMLERALQQAREGQLIGLAIVKVSREPIMFSQQYHTEPDSSHSLAAGVMSLGHCVSIALSNMD